MMAGKKRFIFGCRESTTTQRGRVCGSRSAGLCCRHVRSLFPALALLVGCGPTVVKVDCLWVADGVVTESGISPARVTLEPDSERRIRVAVVEDASLGTGRAWRASVWMAAFQASMATGQDLADWLISVDVETGGQGIDGPSAGGLLTAAIMAGMTGSLVDPGFTMTGTVNPDGTIGPVHGIPDKFRAAIQAGKTTLGYPVGQAEDRDLSSGQQVALKTLSQPGVQVVEVSDIWQAYTLLTGKTLIRPVPVDEDEMALPPSVVEAMNRLATNTIAECEGLRSEYRKLGYANADVDRLWETAADEWEDARALIDAGEPAAAFWRASTAHVRALAGYQVGRLLTDDDPARVLDVMARGAETAAAFAWDQKAEASTVLSATRLFTRMDAQEAALAAVRAYRKGRRAHKTALAQWEADPNDRQAMQLAIGATFDYATATQNGLVAGFNRSFFGADDGIAADPDDLDRLEQVLGSAAGAYLAYFEAMAAGTGGALADRDYPKTRDAPRLARDAAAQYGLSKQDTRVARLSAALAVYVNAAMLITKHYSVDVKLTDLGAVTNVGRRVAFETMLDTSEKIAREHAARAKTRTGRIPVPARIAFAIGRAYRERPGAADRLAALEQFWRASLFCRLAVSLSPKER